MNHCILEEPWGYPDSVVFLNGLTVGLLELKHAAAGGATIWSAYAQLQS